MTNSDYHSNKDPNLSSASLLAFCSLLSSATSPRSCTVIKTAPNERALIAQWFPPSPLLPPSRRIHPLFYLQYLLCLLPSICQLPAATPAPGPFVSLDKYCRVIVMEWPIQEEMTAITVWPNPKHTFSFQTPLSLSALLMWLLETNKRRSGALWASADRLQSDGGGAFEVGSLNWETNGSVHDFDCFSGKKTLAPE